MRIRLTKDLPGAKAGEVFETNISLSGCDLESAEIGNVTYRLTQIQGWYKEVKEEDKGWMISSEFEVQQNILTDDTWDEEEKAMYPIFRTKESAEKYRDALKETYGKKLCLSTRGKTLQKLVDALNDRVQ